MDTLKPTPLAGNRDGSQESLAPKPHLSLSYKLPLSHTESHGKKHSDIKSETGEALIFFS